MGILKKRHTKNSKLSKSLKIKATKQPYVLKTLGELLAEGFSLHQSLQFMQILMKKETQSFDYMISKLEEGSSLESSLELLGYANSIIAQIFYAQRQGRFIDALLEASQQIEEAQGYQRKLVKMLIYPLFLGIGLIGMLFAMRLFLLPQIASFITQEVYDQQMLVRILVAFFTYLPQIFGILLACVLIIYGSIDLYLLKQTELRRYQILTRIPGLRKWVKSYSSHIVAREIGHFFKGGYSIQQTITVLIDYPINPFLSEVAAQIKVGMLNGEDLADILKDLAIFTDELPIVIYQGELISQTAQKCQLYAKKVYTDLMEDVQAKLSLVQPVLFILIAILVMSMYLLMMLPMLTMEGI